MKRSYLLNLRLYKYQINKLRLSGSSYICAQSLPKLKLVIIDGLDYDVGMEELRRNNLGRENSFPDSELKTGFWGLESFFFVLFGKFDQNTKKHLDKQEQESSGVLFEYYRAVVPIC